MLNLTRTVGWSAGVCLASMAITIGLDLSGHGVMMVDLMGYCAGPALLLWVIAILATGCSFEGALATIWILALPMAGLLGASMGTAVISP